MAIPVYLWLHEDDGKRLKGGVGVRGREGSTELVGMRHGIFIPTDNMSGVATGTRQHEAYTFENEIAHSARFCTVYTRKPIGIENALATALPINTKGVLSVYAYWM